MGVLVRSRRVKGSRAYHWGEDGLAGISDDRQHLCFALALWNGSDLPSKRTLGKTRTLAKGKGLYESRDIRWMSGCSSTSNKRWRTFRGDQVRRDREKKVGRNLKDECVATR